MKNVVSVSMFENKRKIIFWLITICCLLALFYISNFFVIGFVMQELLTNGLLFRAVILLSWLALLPFAFITSIYFLFKGRGALRVLLWLVLCLIIFGTIIIPFFNIEFFRKVPDDFLFLAFPVSLIGTLLIFDSKDAFRKGYSIFLLIAMLLCIPTILKDTLPYLYSPPVLTKKSVKAYNEALLFLQERDYLTTFRINMRDWILPDVEKVMTKDDLEQARKIRDKLIKVAYYQFEKIDNLVLFYKHGNRILPPGPGVVYSLTGSNPNAIDNKQVDELKPFENLTGNWYISHNMTFVGPRIDIRTSTPKALFDRSKTFDGIPSEELHRFDNWQGQKKLQYRE